MTVSTVAERLRAEFCPPLDTSLLSALLLDFPDPPSTEDEWLLRATLKSLSADVDAEERVEFEDPTAEGRGSDVVSGSNEGSRNARSKGTEGTGGTADRSASELGSALEVWSLGGGEDDGERREGGEARRFWQGSTTSAESTSPTPPIDYERQEVPDDPLAFLANVFPDLPLGTLEARLSVEGASNDLEGIVDDLLSQAFITSITSEESDVPTSTTPAPPKTKAEKLARRRAKAALKASTTLSLTSTPHLLPPSQTSATVPPSNDLLTPAIALAAPTTNRWASLSSHSTNLSTLLHLPPARITSTYHSCSSSLPLTLSTLLNSLSHSRPFAHLPNAELLKDQLAAVLPKVKDDRLEILLSATEGDLADAMDLQRTIDEIERTEGKLTWSELFEADPQAVPSSSSSTAALSKPISSLPSTSTPSAAAESPEQHYTSLDCYHYAHEFETRRNEAIRSAARHFQRGGRGERGAAFYWAQEGRDLDGKRRVWMERAARAVVRERRINDKNTIDLHGLTLHHAQTVVRESCNSWWAASSSPTPPPLRIITGLGRHSTNNNPVLLPAITKLLDREGWRWKWDNGPTGGDGGPGTTRGAVWVTGVTR
ncbi:hypothetical protein BCR35DRAFT_326384 [Leucosporidium creatinivorum]|uniref:Smr domain-containing protein n=1 Tax=Leucosporidium creatinivorum TaxID=106004 RepID=A0A1Y2EDC3_9BASI|nr:hypothetical protein BCR35DRAFT_326384 [Leucosporidium creatinivorum]